MTQTAQDPLTQLEKTGEKEVTKVEKSLDALLSQVLHLTEQVAELKVQHPQSIKDLEKKLMDTESSLRDAIASAREEQSKVANDTVRGLEDRLAKIEKTLDDLLTGGEEDQNEPPHTKVDQVHNNEQAMKELTTITNKPTEIHPPEEPRGIRGRRQARRQRHG